MTRGRKKTDNAKEVKVQVRIDQELNKALESFMKASGINRSEAIRMILKSTLK